MSDTHGESVSSRPIVNAINSITYKLEGYLAQVLKRKNRKITSNIRNLTQFTENSKIRHKII